MSDFEFRDFYVYYVEDDGTYNELNIEQDKIAEALHDEEVLLIVKEDIRRLFIWKGPKSPVRKRFISSRVAAGLQDEIRKKTGMHLKIVSVDAGDEPVEFLSTFNLESYEVTGKLEDMRYIRNIDKERMRQAQITRNIEKRKKEAEEEYVSPLLQEAQEGKQGQIEIAFNQSGYSANSYPSYSSYSKSPQRLPAKQLNEKKILESILKIPPPNGYKRMNIIIGNKIFAPKSIKTVILGKNVTKQEWNAVDNLSDLSDTGYIDIEMDFLRIYIDDKYNYVKGIEIYHISDEEGSRSDTKSPNITKTSEEKIETTASSSEKSTTKSKKSTTKLKKSTTKSKKSTTKSKKSTTKSKKSTSKRELPKVPGAD
ncbi:MAG: hypothetical protein ACTSO2_09390 [Promethearchaeota archaeon]